MAEPLDWLFEITDGFSGPLGQMDKALSVTDRILVQATGHLARIDSALNKAGAASTHASGGHDRQKKSLEGLNIEFGKLGGLNLNALQKGTGSLFTFDLVSAGRAFIGIIESAVSAVARLGTTVVKSAAAYGDLQLAARLNLGDTEGPRFLEHIDTLAKKTRFDDDELIKAVLPLQELGLRDKALDDALTAAIDVSERRGTGLAGVQEAISAFEKIQITREVSAKSLKPLGINEKDFFAQLGQQEGVSAAAAEALVKAGKVKGDRLIAVAIGAVGAREKGGLGSGAVEGGKTLTATLNRLENLPNNLFKQLAGSPGLVAIQDILDNFVSILSGPLGGELINTVGGAFSEVVKAFFGDLSGPDGGAKLEAQISTVLADLKAWVPVLTTAAGLLRDILDITLAIPRFYTEFAANRDRLLGGGGIKAGPGPRGEPVEPPTLATGLWDTFWDLTGLRAVEHGNGVSAGLAKGIRDGIPEVTAATRELATVPGDVTRDVTQTHSPSRVFWDIGRGGVGAGFAGGIEASGDDVERAARDGLVAPAARAVRDGDGVERASGGEGAPLLGGVSMGDVIFQIAVDGAGGNAREVAEATLERLRQESPALLAMMLSRLREEMGA